jgi:hypothetical protein
MTPGRLPGPRQRGQAEITEKLLMDCLHELHGFLQKEAAVFNA